MTTSGAFRLYVKPREDVPWGLVECFPYDDASRKKRKRRDAVLSTVRLTQMRWYYNYTQWRGAAFCVEEQVDVYSLPIHILGTKRIKPKRQGGSLKRKPWPIKKPRKARKAKRVKPKKRNRK